MFEQSFNIFSIAPSFDYLYSILTYIVCCIISDIFYFILNSDIFYFKK